VNKEKNMKNNNKNLRHLFGKQFCACGCGHKLLCEGSCRASHLNQETNDVECPAIYTIEQPKMRKSKRRERDKDENLKNDFKGRRFDKKRSRNKKEKQSN